ncbi:hypothetical protein PYW08_006115 [Mythimna loreyi]|uniref:Uncharacterized protein n=1 Tax=Mythimna loreyi TaxID=667449 RepID=A0ACC2QM83_9NEOP|nr:hypothetical protein PYW08_006115 [Mythimna loreyi]
MANTDYGSMNVSALKVKLRKRGAKLNGLKEQLIQRLQNYDRNNNFVGNITDGIKNDDLAYTVEWPSDSSYISVTSKSVSPDLDIVNISTYFLEVYRDNVARREEFGEFHTLYNQLREDEKEFADYFRMDVKTLDKLLNFIHDKLKHQNTNMRDSITPTERLAVTLRYLATGHTFADLRYAFRIGKTTLSFIIKEVLSDELELELLLLLVLDKDKDLVSTTLDNALLLGSNRKLGSASESSISLSSLRIGET